MGVSMLTAGFFGSMAIGRALDMTKKYKLVMISTSAVCCLAQVAFTLLVAKGFVWLDHVILAILGICGTAMINLTVQYGIELTYPQPVPVMAGLTCLFAQLFGFIVTELGKYDSYFISSYWYWHRCDNGLFCLERFIDTCQIDIMSALDPYI